jgi:cytochrome oxidase Cu insertion factor (SCO1/SenC/PrrC family)
MQKNLKIILVGLWVVAGFTVGGVAAGVWWYRQRPGVAAVTMGTAPELAANHLAPMYDAPAFALTDENGKPFGSGQLSGEVWVADFVFTTCTGLCPMMTEQMHEFQKLTDGSGIQMVSFSVDPEHDTPAALLAYANMNGADLSRWHFLTGEKETLWQISNGMKLAVGAGDSNHQVMHSSHFLLVDASGHVRGVYDYKDAGYLKRLVNDANSLIDKK